MRRTAIIDPRVGWRRLLPALAAAVLALTAVAAVGGFGSVPAEAQSADCVTASNLDHIEAGRATQSLAFARAVGSNDFLGLVWSTTSLQRDGSGWRRVDRCGPPGSSTTTSTSVPGGGGDRPPLSERYQAMYETDPRLPRHTVYRPRNLDQVTEPMPIVVWGNGACSANGTWFQEFLTPLAAHGVLVIANGTPNGSGTTNSDMLIDAIDWAVAENSRPGSKYQGRLDTDAIAAMGQSCGGLEAIDASRDVRVDSTVLWNSGIFSSGGLGGVDKSALQRLHAPVAWFTGGRSDIAYGNAVDDYQRVPSRVPAVLGHYDNVGHTGLFTNPEVERHIVTVAAQWLDATLYDNAQARSQFVGQNCGLCSGTPWEIQSKNW
ncbi:MAG TPA: hypothetical protein VIL48_12040 [Acidimicrobiales bacterium]